MGHTRIMSPHDAGLRAARERQRRVLRAVLAVNAGYLVVEVVGGLAFGSLSLLADAAHMFSDVVALLIALGAHALVARPSSPRHSFGLQRAEVLGAQANGVLLVAGAGWILVEAMRRLGDAPAVEGPGLLVVGSLGLVVNLASAWVLLRWGRGGLNMRALLLHVAADAAGSAGAIVAGVAVVVAGTDWVDPAVSVLIGLLVLGSAWRLLRDTAHVLLEGTPPDLHTDEVVAAMQAVDGVVSVHHVHLWSLASDVPALSAHVVLTGNPSLHEAQERGDRLRRELEQRFGIGHATLDLECHVCESPPAEADIEGPTPPPGRRRRPHPPAPGRPAPGVARPGGGPHR